MPAHIAIPAGQIADFCQRHHIRKLALFGSVLTAEFRPDSDIDVWVKFEPEARVGFFKFIDAQEELGALLGRTVDLNTPEDLSRHFRHKVVKIAQALYERER